MCLFQVSQGREHFEPVILRRCYKEAGHSVVRLGEETFGVPKDRAVGKIAFSLMLLNEHPSVTDCMFIVQIIWDTEFYESVDFYLEDGPEIIIHW